MCIVCVLDVVCFKGGLLKGQPHGTDGRPAPCTILSNDCGQFCHTDPPEFVGTLGEAAGWNVCAFRGWIATEQQKVKASKQFLMCGDGRGGWVHGCCECDRPQRETNKRTGRKRRGESLGSCLLLLLVRLCVLACWLAKCVGRVEIDRNANGRVDPWNRLERRGFGRRGTPEGCAGRVCACVCAYVCAHTTNAGGGASLTKFGER